MSLLKNIGIKSLIVVMLACGAASCSTGIEGTKTIKMSRAERRETAPTDEEVFARQFASQRLDTWRPGKQFLVVDQKARLIYDFDGLRATDSVTGRILSFETMELLPDPGGRDVVAIRFRDGSGRVRYRTSLSAEKGVADISGLDMPMVVDLDLVALADSLMRGKTLWVRSRLWYDDNANPYDGRKFVAVTISRVRPGNAVFPLIVDFVDDKGAAAHVYMNVKGETGLGAESRTFPTLFSLTDPKTSYPSIQPEIWDNIRNGKVAVGMTKDECKLALGNPTDVDTGHTWGNLVEIWGYKDGKFLYFEDGRLANFRN